MTAEVVKPKKLEEHQSGACVIARSGNVAAFYVYRRHFSTKPIMVMCIEFQSELEEKCDLSVMLDHIPGKIKKISDYLSRERIREAVDLMKARRGQDPVRVELGA